LTEASLVDALSGYNAADASKVSHWIRQEADLEQYLDQLELLYHGAVQRSQDETVSPDSKFRAAANYLQELAPLVKRQAEVEQRAAGFEQHAQLLEQQLQQLQSQLQEGQTEQEQTAQEYAEFRGSIAGRLALKLQRMRLWLTGPR
jgi:chromosome segregation ATPase